MYCYKNFIGTLPLFFNFVFVFVVVCLFVLHFFKGIDGRLSGPLTALITEILTYVNNEKDPKPIMLCGCFVMSRSCQFVLIT